MSTDALSQKIDELRDRIQRARSSLVAGGSPSERDRIYRMELDLEKLQKDAAKAAAANDNRKREIQHIQILRRKVYKNDERAYRDLLWTQARVKSTTELDELQRRKILDLLKAKQPTSSRWISPRVTMPPHKQRMAKKVCAILGNNGLTHEYADGIAKQMQQVDRWEFLHADNLHDLIAALEKQYGTHGRARRPNARRD